MKPRPLPVRRWEALPIQPGCQVARQSRICGRTLEHSKTRLAHSAPKGPRRVAGGGARIAEGDTSGAPGTRSRPEEPQRGEGEDGSGHVIDWFFSVAPSGLGPLGAPTGGSLRSPPATLRQPFGLLCPGAAEALDRGRSHNIKIEAHSIRAKRLLRNPPAGHPPGDPSCPLRGLHLPLAPSGGLPQAGPWAFFFAARKKAAGPIAWTGPAAGLLRA